MAALDTSGSVWVSCITTMVQRGFLPGKTGEPVVFQLFAIPELAGLGGAGLSGGSPLGGGGLLARSLCHDARQQLLQLSAVCTENTRRDELCASGVSSSPVVSSTVHSTKSGVW